MTNKYYVSKIISMVLLFLICLLSSFITFAQVESGVVAEGMAPIIEGNLEKARAEAINTAVLNAFREVMQRSFQSAAVKSLGPMAFSKYEQDIQKYFSSYEVLEEQDYGDSYWVKLQVYQVAEIIKQKGMDRIKAAIFTEEKVIEGDEYYTSSVCGAQLKRSFEEAGLRIITPSIRLHYASPNKAIASLGQESEIDLIILADAATEKFDIFGNFLLYKADIKARVVNGFTVEEIAHFHTIADGERKLTPQEAAESSLSNAGEEAGTYLIKQLIAKSENLLTRKVYIKNIEKQEDINKVLSQLPRMTGINHVSIELFSKEKMIASLIVRMNYRFRDRLGSYLEHLRGIKLRVKKNTPFWIEVIKE